MKKLIKGIIIISILTGATATAQIASADQLPPPYSITTTTTTH